MISHPDKAKDVDVEVIAYVDGYDPNTVRIVNNEMCDESRLCPSTCEKVSQPQRLSDPHSRS
jgi:hypothetical protein